MGDVQNVDSEYFVAFISQLGMQSHRQRNSSAPLLLILMNKVKYIQFTITTEDSIQSKSLINLVIETGPGR
jgi:hypothetical protein